MFGPQTLRAIHPHFITNPFPDETLFSYCSRHHRISGNARSYDTCMQLFGHRFAGTQHDLCARLDEFSARTQEALGTPREIALNRTLLPFLVMFRVQEDLDDAIDRLRGNSIGSLKYVLGLLASGFRANHPLKACNKCSEDDLSAYGTSYWHLAHQHPSVLVCPTHGISLAEYQLKANGVDRFLWHLPDYVISTDGRFLTPHRSDLEKLLQLARLTISAVEFSRENRFDMERLRRTYLGELVRREVLTSGGKLRAKQASAMFCAEMDFVSRVPEFSAISTDVAMAAPQLSKILLHPSRQTYPIRHLVIIQWLFGDWETFFSAYSNADDISILPVGPADKTSLEGDVSPRDSTQERIRTKVIDEGASLTQCAKDLKLDLKTVMLIATRLGIQIARRAKRLKPDIRTRLIADLTGGMDKKTAATKFAISVQTVTTTLQTEPGLSEKWHTTRRERARAENRASWHQAIAENPSFSIKQLRMIQPATYGWLYRNDHQWLLDTYELIPPAVRTPTTKVDWDARDDELAAEVLKTAAELPAANPTRKLSLQDIYRHIPELRAKLGTLSRLPRTQLALEQVVRSGRKGKAGTLI
jgi:transposase